MKITTVNSIEHFHSLRKDWNEILFMNMPDNIFMTWEWQYSWWETYSRGKELFIILCFEDSGNLIGIGPFFVADEKILGIPIRTLKLIGSEEVCSEYLDVIAYKNRISEVTRALACYLKESSEWDIIHFKDVPEKSLIDDMLREMKEGTSITCTDSPKTINPFISLPKKEDIFLAGLSQNKRGAIKRKENKLRREHGFSIVEIDENVDLEDAFQNFVVLHQKLWESRGFPGMFKRKAFLGFHRSVSRRFLENDWLRLYFLTVNGKSVASLYGFQSRDKFYYYQSGFDPEWRGYGVGTLLLTHTILEAIRSKMKEYDFLRGEADYKFDFTTTFRHTREILVPKDTYKGSFYFLHREMRKRCREAVKRCLPENILSKARKVRDHIVLR